MSSLPRRPLTNIDLEKFAKMLKIPSFRGVFMRNALPNKPKVNECAIINLDNYEGSGTHWVAYKKKKNIVNYFDSFGDLRPPQELVRYFDKCKIVFNYNRYQNYNTFNCGHLCLEFLNI